MCSLPYVTMTSTFRRTKSVAISAERSFRPSAQRRSILMVRSSIQPSSRSRCAKATTHAPAVMGVPEPRKPMVGTFAGCCARAASGHAATPPSSVMNSPRVIRLIFKPVKWALFTLKVSGTGHPGHFGFILRSFDHLVGAAKQWQRDCYAKHLGSLEVQEHLDLRGLLNRQLARLFAFENTGGVDASQTVSVGKATAIAHQAAGGDELAVFEDRRYRVTDGQCGELFAPANEEPIGADHERAGPDLGQVRKDRIEIVLGAGMHDTELQPERVCRRLQVPQLRLGRVAIGRVDQRGNDWGGGHQLVRQLQSLRCQLYSQCGRARDIATRSAHARDEADLHWIAGGSEDDGGRRDRRL